MIFKICYTNKTLINQTKILDFVKEQMESETFQKLQNHRFKKTIKINHVDSENELHYIWEHRRDITHPHGKVKIFCSGGLILVEMMLEVYGLVLVLKIGSSIHGLKTNTNSL